MENTPNCPSGRTELLRAAHREGMINYLLVNATGLVCSVESLAADDGK